MLWWFSFGGYMALGVCCQWLEERVKRDNSVVYDNILNQGNLQLGAFKAGKYNEDRIRDTYVDNIQEHINFFPILLKHNIRSFRMSSAVFPLFEYNDSLIRSNLELQNKLKQLGKLFIDNNIRVTTHPGQFVIINSDTDRIIENSVRELSYHAWTFDMMGLPLSPYYAINIHGGKRDKIDKLIEVTNSLPDNIRKRLTFENDERCYNVKQLLQVHEKTGVPVVFDSHHYTFNNNDLALPDAFAQSIQTWGNTKPLQHISNTELGMESGTFTERRAHSAYIRYVPELQLEAACADTIDIDVEAKMKNFAVLQMRKEYGIQF
jgi:UV DNA damage endonuclease